MPAIMLRNDNATIIVERSPHRTIRGNPIERLDFASVCGALRNIAVIATFIAIEFYLRNNVT